MSKGKKLVSILVLILVVLGLALPVSNLLRGLPRSASVSAIETQDQAFAQARDIMAGKCATCHSSEGAMPLYASLPVAKTMIEADVKTGTDYLNLQKELMPAPGLPASEATLAKIEKEIQDGAMPPMRFLMLHWNGALSESEEQQMTAWIQKTRSEHFATKLAAAQFANEPVQPLPLSVEADAAKVALGDKLFHDVRLSKDNSISCASCHALDKGGTDRVQYSTGVGGAVGGINSPTVYNSTYHFIQFWDGRAANLAEQADGPVNNPIEMASNWEEVCGKLNQDAAFLEEFKKVYPEGPSKETIIDAIATFESTLITPNSRFDKYLMGQTGALTAEDETGYHLFKEYGCATCHTGKNLGGQSFEKMGRKGDYFATRPLTDADNGRFSVTKDEADRHKFKTPTLRNIALTAPYMHDGSATDLTQAVDVMLKQQVGSSAPAQEVAAMVAFLNTLNGEYKGQLLQ
ncbi:MAG: heme-binding domain-containing protein [Candidatus Hydrogenedentes bacterium]|nr:heme-binding domain-containing protein [Candidatus Hydrogenedentota bacterium]